MFKLMRCYWFKNSEIYLLREDSFYNIPTQLQFFFRKGPFLILTQLFYLLYIRLVFSVQFICVLVQIRLFQIQIPLARYQHPGEKTDLYGGFIARLAGIYTKQPSEYWHCFQFSSSLYVREGGEDLGMMAESRSSALCPATGHHSASLAQF